MIPPVQRARMSEVIRRRARVTPVVAVLLSLGFALAVAPIALVDAWLAPPTVVAGQPADLTVRVPAFEGWDDHKVSGRGGSVVIARGEIATPRQAQLVAAMRAAQPSAGARVVAYAAVLFVLALGVTHQLRRSNRGRLLRVQLVLLGTVALGAVVTKGLLLAYPLSVLAVPVALGALVPTLVFDRTVGLAAGVLSAVTLGLLVPFDVGISTVLVVQAVAAAIVVPERARPRWPIALAAGAMAMIGAALTYLGFHYLSDGVVPVAELADPGRSAWLAAAFGGAVAGVLAMPLVPVFERACGEITHGRLVALEDLSHPLLRQIAEKSPGTWQHSLAMANLAEVAANSIGASGRLVRVGAYFHDLGKSLQPTYFIENLRAGEPSPHDQLAPEVSSDAIFAHVTEGIATARRHGVPERIIDFMHMHHGDGVLEYFWAKCQEQGNPRRLTIDDFRYPGVRPQSRETAILAICDAVEAASRTLKRPDDRAIETLVQRIVYGKLHLGQLDESGLSMADLRRISDSLREAIRAAHHDRIEYPWQREAAAGRVTSPTQRLMREPRLDSLDTPRPQAWERAASAAEPAMAATEPVPSPLPIAATTPLPLPAAEAATMSLGPAERAPAAGVTEPPPTTPTPIESAEELSPLVIEPAIAGSSPQAVVLLRTPVEAMPAVLPLPAPAPSAQHEVPRGAWASSLASRLDAMLEDDEQAFAHAPTHKTAPPPPPRGRVTHEVLPEDVEATIDLTPTARSERSEHSQLIKGPPPATRPIPTLPATEPAAEREDGPTVVRTPPGSMLPPRSRTKAD
jgi:putative nucleotidyltransferase with HDIG domain